MSVNIVHLKPNDEEGVIELWGGPLYVEADNLNAEDEAELAAFSRTLTYLWEREGDDGPFWRRKMVLVGPEIHRVKLDEQNRPHVQLPEGSWLMLDCDGIDLADEASVLGIYGDPVEIPLLPAPRDTFRSLGVRGFTMLRAD